MQNIEMKRMKKIEKLERTKRAVQRSEVCQSNSKNMRGTFYKILKTAQYEEEFTEVLNNNNVEIK